jgi:hypothetical protein
VAVASGAALLSPSVGIDGAGDATIVWLTSSDGATFSASAAQLDAQSGSWSAEHQFPSLGPAESGTQPTVRIDAAGDAVAVWIEQDPGHSSNDVVRAVDRAGADGAWSAPVKISGAAGFSVESFGSPQLVSTGGGAALAAWTAQDVGDGSSHVQQAALAGGTWSTATDVAASSTDFIGPVEMAGDGADDAVAAWFIGSPATLQAGVRASGVWSVSDVPGDVAPACTPQSAVGEDAHGAATLVWTAANGDAVSSSFAGAGWSAAPAHVYEPAANESVLGARLAGAIALFTTADAGSGDAAMRAAQPDGAGGWSAPTTLATTSDGSDLSIPAAASDAAGDLLAAWTATDDAGNGTISAARFVEPPQPPTVTQPSPPTPPTTSVHPPATLLPPLLVVHNATLRLGRGAPLVVARLVNRDAVALHGSATLATIPSHHHRAQTLAVQRHVQLSPHGRPLLHLRLSGAALVRLRSTRGHVLAARLSLAVRAPNGHLLRVAARYRLDATARFGGARPTPAARRVVRARIAC